MNRKIEKKTNEIPEIVLVGLSHKSAPVDIREKFTLDEKIIPEFLEKAKKGAINEIVYLSTCNRMSVYFTAVDVHRAVNHIISLLEEYSGLQREMFENYLYRKYSRDAILHLLSVASSLDSMVVGENEIIGQVKQAYRASVDNKKTGILLNRLFHQAFNTAKKVMTETKISQNPLSIAFIAVERAKSVFGDLSDKKTLLIGAGEMGELILKYFTKSSVREITIANRSLHNAEKIVNEINREAHVIPLDDIELAAVDADIIITSISCQNHVLGYDLLKRISEKRDEQLFLIDIAVPRNIDPSAAELSRITLFNIDDLKQISDENMKNRLGEIEMASRIVNSDATEFFTWYEGLEVVPIINKLQKKFDEVRINELKRYRQKKLKHLSETDFAFVENLTEQIMTKTLHNPIMALKRYQTSRSNSHLDLESIIEELFKKQT